MVTKENQESYYKGELSKINTNFMYSPQFKFRDETDQTKWISLNDESAKVLLKWIKKNFNLK